MTKLRRITARKAVAVLLAGVAMSATAGLGARAQGPIPISEGSWLGELHTSCSPESGTTRDYECNFTGVAPSEYPPGSHCTETPAGPIVVSLECAASMSATTEGKLTRAGCFSGPRPGQVLSTNGSVTIVSAAMQQSYYVPVKVWVTRGAGSFSGVANYYPVTAVKVSGSFTTDCGQLQSTGVFRGEFTITVARR